MLDLHDKRYTSYNTRGAHKDNMAVRKQLVDVMFKRFDANGDGRVEAGELSQVRLLESEERSKTLLDGGECQNSIQWNPEENPTSDTVLPRKCREPVCFGERFCSLITIVVVI